MLIGGGSTLQARRDAEPIEVVDLQGLELKGIARLESGAVSIGAGTDLQAVASSDLLPASLRAAARREKPSTLRTRATLGGLIARGESESGLLAVLLAHETTVEVSLVGEVVERELGAVLAALPLAPAEILLRARLDPAGAVAVETTARTVADRPIVAAVCRKAPDGRVLVALAGVAPTPVLFELPAPAGSRLDLSALEPASDFRGSAEYRRALASVLAARVVEEVS